MNKRIDREKRTVNNMIAMYCKNHHNQDKGVCVDCSTLMSYSNERLNKCVFGTNKPACSKCPVHCYKADKRGEIKVIMRYSGPRMIYTHPYLAVMHIIDKRKKANK